MSAISRAPLGPQMKLETHLSDQNNSWSRFMGIDQPTKPGDEPRDLEAEKQARIKRFEADKQDSKRLRGPPSGTEWSDDTNVDHARVSLHSGSTMPLKKAKCLPKNVGTQGNLAKSDSITSDCMKSQTAVKSVGDGTYSTAVNDSNATNAVSVTTLADDCESDEEEIVTVGALVGTSYALEKSYLRLTGEAKAYEVRPLAVLRQAFERLRSDKAQDLKNKGWNWLSDQLRAIRQDLQVQNIENTLTAEVYAANGLWALHYCDLGQFHQCAMQLRQLQTNKPDLFSKNDFLRSKGSEFCLLRGVYNVFMGLEHIKEDRIIPPSSDSCTIEANYPNAAERSPKSNNVIDYHSGSDNSLLRERVCQLINAFRRKEFPTFFKIRRSLEGPLGDLCASFDNVLLCQALARLLSGFKVEKPNFEVLAWTLGLPGGEAELRTFLTATARLKEIDSIQKSAELAKHITESVAMNIKHAMKA